MLVENKSKRMYVHSVLNAKRQAEMLILNPGEHKEIPDDVAKQWLKTGEVIKYADPVAVEKEKAAKEKEVEALKAEIERLKAEAKEKPAAENKPETDGDGANVTPDNPDNKKDGEQIVAGDGGVFDENGEPAKEKSLDELKAEADELGISYAKNIGAAKLQEKINKFKEEK